MVSKYAVKEVKLQSMNPSGPEMPCPRDLGDSTRHWGHSRLSWLSGVE